MWGETGSSGNRRGTLVFPTRDQCVGGLPEERNEADVFQNIGGTRERGNISFGSLENHRLKSTF